MNNAYRKLMEQISLSDQAKQTFYSHSKQPDNRKSRWMILKAAAVVACIVLLVPVTVLALEHVFGLAIINRVDRPDADNRPGVGVDVKYGDVKSRPITDFPEHLRKLDNNMDVTYQSWEEAEADLGIDLLNSRVCDDEGTKKIDYYVDDELVEKHCTGRYLAKDGQLYYAKLRGIYRRNSVKFQITALITAEHPSITEEALLQYHNSSRTYFDSFAPQVETEQYVTNSGIPVTVCVVTMEDEYGTFTDYSAYLAVNDVTYCVSYIGMEGTQDDARIYSVIQEVLEGFAVE